MKIEVILNLIAKLNLLFVIWVLSGFASLYFRFDGNLTLNTYFKILPSALFLTIIFSLVNYFDLKIFGKAKKTTIEESFRILRIFLITGFILFIILSNSQSYFLPRSFPILTTILALGLYLISKKLITYVIQKFTFKSKKIPIALYGAGNQAVQLIKKIISEDSLDWKPVAILEDNKSLNLNSIEGVKIVKELSMEKFLEYYKPKILIITFTTISNSRLNEIQNLCDKYLVQLRFISPIRAISGQELLISDIRVPTQEELIGKSSIKIDSEQIRKTIYNKIVLITGAGGSIGSEISRQVCFYNPAKVVLLDRDESALLEAIMSITVNGSIAEYVLADIRDKESLTNIMSQFKPDIVFHAAALKHLNLLEKFPMEGIKTNVMGTNTILSEATKNSVKLFVNISTDKAADPISILGKTKLLSERLTAHYANQPETKDSKYISVRFGNVFGSRGSVLHIFRKQIENNSPITITHPDVSRFFMTLQEAVYLVLRATVEGNSGDTLILEMGKPILIKDIAEKLIKASGKNIQIQYSNLQPGEKLVETLIGKNEIQIKTEMEGVIKVRVEPTSPTLLGSNLVL
jgi:FlaA1/EpsC-like NDP-sugar epimerase